MQTTLLVFGILQLTLFLSDPISQLLLLFFPVSKRTTLGGPLRISAADNIHDVHQ